MKSRLSVILFIVITTHLKAQSPVEWYEGFKLELTNFRSPTTQIGDITFYSVQSVIELGFSYRMSGYEFMFTKNFNSKVSCTFDPEASSIIAPDKEIADALIRYAQYEFDLCELYARKLRKSLYENKDAFSDAQFFEPIYKKIHEDYNHDCINAGKLTDLGKDKEKIEELHSQVLQQIQQLSFFCKTCKPEKIKND